MQRSIATGLLAALLLVTGCAAAPAPAATEPAATESPAPTATADEPQAKVPFGGDCSTVLGPDVVADIFDGQPPTVSARTHLGGVMPDTSGSLAQLGGLACNWASPESEIAFVGVVLLPVAEVPAEIVAAHEDFGCYGWSICGRAETVSGMWVLVETPVLDQNAEALSDSDEQLLTSVVDAAIGSVVAHPAAVYAGVAVTPAADWWTLPSCDALESVAASAAGMTTPEAGFPGDNVPEGPVWETLEASGIVKWCPWYEPADQSTRITALQFQSGVGVPSAARLAAAGAEAITIPGADAAYRLVQDDGGGARSVEVLVIAGPNRLLVGGDQQEAVATAVLASLSH